MHPALKHAPANFIGESAAAIPGGALVSRNPARPAEVIWSGCPVAGHVDEAVRAARRAFPAWWGAGAERRFAVLRRFRDLCAARVDDIAGLIRDEVGKAAWDARAEAELLASKVDITLAAAGGGGEVPAALSRVSGYEVAVSATRAGRCWFRPHGVMGVLGPFNFPAHLPNGHIVPALAMGNTVVFKPSEKAPGVGQLLAELLREALESEGMPTGAVNLVQGGAEVASRLAGHEGIDGILFTGSFGVGRRILEANLDRPGRIVALEMGGNNAAIVMPDADLRQAAVECVRSAFVTAGQRCTCTRRLVVHAAVAERVIAGVCKAAANLIVGDPRAGHPVFMGPMISEGARRAVLEFQARARAEGGEVLVPCTPVESPGGGWYLSAGVMRVERFVAWEEPFEPGADVEVFGPLLRVCVVEDLEGAMEQANATRYGLAASIFARDEDVIARFVDGVRAGCVNVNTGTAGASSKLPFGGLGLSGNHRPAGAFSLDYSAYPVAGLVERGGGAAVPPGMLFRDEWL